MILFLLIIYSFRWISKLVHKGYIEDEKKVKLYHYSSSIAILLLFIVAQFMTFLIVMNIVNSYLPLVISFIVVGISSISWCYGRCTLFSQKIEFHFEDKTESRIKRIIVFSCIFIFVIFIGFIQFYDIVNKANDTTCKCFVAKPVSDATFYSIINLLLISVVIAFDRILNQFQELMLGKNKEKTTVHEVEVTLNKEEAETKEYDIKLNIKGLIVYADIAEDEDK